MFGRKSGVHSYQSQSCTRFSLAEHSQSPKTIAMRQTSLLPRRVTALSNDTASSGFSLLGQLELSLPSIGSGAAPRAGRQTCRGGQRQRRRSTSLPAWIQWQVFHPRAHAKHVVALRSMCAYRLRTSRLGTLQPAGRNHQHQVTRPSDEAAALLR